MTDSLWFRNAEGKHHVLSEYFGPGNVHYGHFNSLRRRQRKLLTTVVFVPLTKLIISTELHTPTILN